MKCCNLDFQAAESFGRIDARSWSDGSGSAERSETNDFVGDFKNKMLQKRLDLEGLS